MKILGFLLVIFGVIVSFSCMKDEVPTATCFDGIQNQNETGVDCGGLCVACQIIPDTTSITLQPDSTSGNDATIHSLDLYTNGWWPHLVTTAWTWQGDPGIMRTLIGFDLSQIPIGTTIYDARLSLYAKPSPPDQHSTADGSNACWIKRITSAWDEDIVSWSSRPSSSDDNQASILSSISPDQDYVDINVTALVQDMINNPNASFGFMIQLQTELPLRMMSFASSENLDSSIHPKLEIEYEK